MDEEPKEPVMKRPSGRGKGRGRGKGKSSTIVDPTAKQGDAVQSGKATPETPEVAPPNGPPSESVEGKTNPRGKGKVKATPKNPKKSPVKTPLKFKHTPKKGLKVPKCQKDPKRMNNTCFQNHV